MSVTAIVTGASRGIGYEICRELARRDADVLAVARSSEPLLELEELHPGRIQAVPADLTDAGEVEELLKIARSTGRVDLLINNAGALVNKPFVDLEMEEWRRLLEVNLLAAVRLVKSLLGDFGEEAHIVNISSMGGYQGSAKFPGLSAYSTAKGALSILSECLAAELNDSGISVNALCLGAVRTEMLEEAFPGFEAPVEAGEMGTYIADFALNGAKFYNGQILPVTLADPD